MNRFIPVLLVTLIPFALCAEDKKEEKKPVAFSSKDGKFAVTLPDKPTEKTNKIKIGKDDAELRIFTVVQEGGAHVITYSDYPAALIGEDKNKFLSGVIERNATALKGKVASDEKVTIGKGSHPGRVIQIELPDKKRAYRAKLFLVGNRLYQVTALGSEEFVKSKAVEEYLKSFAIEE